MLFFVSAAVLHFFNEFSIFYDIINMIGGCFCADTAGGRRKKNGAGAV